MRLGKLYQFGLRVLRSSPLITFLIFRVRIHCHVLPVFWDVTTLVLQKAIDEHIASSGKRVLEMGCGHIALLTQYAKMRSPTSDVQGVDMYPEFAQCARTNAQKNACAIQIIESDLFQNVQGNFDIIFFNPPYVPLNRVDSPHSHAQSIFSGDDGMETTRRFLTDAKAHVNPAGKILLGINCFYVPQQTVEDIAKHSGYHVLDVVSRRANTARVFVLRPSS